MRSRTVAQYVSACRGRASRMAAEPSWASLDSLDSVFLGRLASVQALYTALPRASQIRAEAWAAALAAEAVGDTWRRARNAYLILC